MVIRCNSDERVFRCIESIDEEADVVVAIGENPILQERLHARDVRYCVVPKGNLSIASNAGFDLASSQKVIVTDSDTVFERGCVRLLARALDDYKVARARLVFRSSPEIPFSDIVGEARDYVNSLPVVYTPGVAVRRDLLRDIGGFLFDDPVPFAVDADLNHRIQAAGIPVAYLKDAILYHDAESLFHDIKAAYRIGRGCRISAVQLSNSTPSQNPRTVQRRLKGVKVGQLLDVANKKGPSVFAYQLLWDSIFHMGGAVEQIAEAVTRGARP